MNISSAGYAYPHLDGATRVATARPPTTAETSSGTVVRSTEALGDPGQVVEGLPGGGGVGEHAGLDPIVEVVTGERPRDATATVEARVALDELGLPCIDLAPGAGHALEARRQVDADAYGVDRRPPIAEAWDRLGDDTAVGGNLDPATLLTDPATIRAAVRRLLDEVGGRPGHVVDLAHGIDRHTPPEHVAALVEAVRP
jgi:hypothetical protein